MTTDIKLFLKKFFILVIPFVIISIIAFSMDPFRVWFNYDDYYKNNFVTLNREFVCYKLFQKNNDNYHYNSLILGSSRSQAFKVKEWEKYLPKDSVGFHFDASGEGIYGIYNKLNFMGKNNILIKNALIMLDYDTLKVTDNRKGYLFISPPELSGDPAINFYRQFFIANLSPLFLIGYIDYKIFQNYRNYMSELFNKSKYDNVSDNITGDLFYGYDKMIAEDKHGYYKTLIEKGVFYERDKKDFKTPEITDKEKELLVKISSLLKKNNSSYKIVISPVYNQIELDNQRLNLLYNFFGKENVYNFSGKNKFTESIYNYYEDSHYRPRVANEIMKQIYMNNQ